MTTLSRRHLMLTATGAALALPFLGRGLAFAQEPAPTAFLPTVHTRALGGMTVTTIADGHFDFAQDLIVNLDNAAYQSALRAAYLDPAQPIRVPVSVHLIRQGDQLTLVDAGGGSAFGPTTGHLAASLEAIGVAPDQIGRVVMTHLHPDHAGGLIGDAGAVFANASLHVHQDELAFWTDEEAAAAAPADFQPFFALAQGVRDAYGDRVQTFADDADLGGGVTVMALPGHTPGHSGLRLSDGDAQMVILGDAAALAALQFRHPDAGIAFDIDGAQAATTRRNLLQMVTADRIAVAGTHLPFPGIGHVESRGDAFAWVPEDWFATRA
ncbi:MAG: MBL fold metallo-hydrolase [Paracoccus hibiscisoli]|uniref:MBL fold metallo-hydrolase n=1 Tax=Paracoccus hibiscisoli TaxID=2023261 RepID=UPI00391ADB6B